MSAGMSAGISGVNLLIAVCLGYVALLFGSLVVCAFAISKPQSGVGGGGGH